MSDIPPGYFVAEFKVEGKLVSLASFRSPGSSKKKKNRGSRKGPKKKSALILKYGMLCHYCNDEMFNDYRRKDGRSVTVEHIVPRSMGGSDAFDNLVLACSFCNNSKGSQYVKCHCIICKRARHNHENNI